MPFEADQWYTWLGIGIVIDESLFRLTNHESRITSIRLTNHDFSVCGNITARAPRSGSHAQME